MNFPEYNCMFNIVIVSPTIQGGGQDCHLLNAENHDIFTDIKAQTRFFFNFIDLEKLVMN